MAREWLSSGSFACVLPAPSPALPCGRGRRQAWWCVWRPEGSCLARLRGKPLSFASARPRSARLPSQALCLVAGRAAAGFVRPAGSSSWVAGDCSGVAAPLWLQLLCACRQRRGCFIEKWTTYDKHMHFTCPFDEVDLCRWSRLCHTGAPPDLPLILCDFFLLQCHHWSASCQ